MLTSVAYRPGRVPATQQQLLPGLFAAHDLYAVRKETLGGSSGTPLGGCCSMHFAQLIKKRMGLAVSVCVRLIRSHLDLRRVEG